MSTPQRTGTDLGERKVLADIAEYGWHCMNVVEDDGHPPWSFSIGFYDTWRFPELIVIGRSRHTAHEMLNTIAGEFDANRPPDIRSGYVLLGMPCHFIEVASHHYADYVGFARWYYRGKHFPLYQIVWSNTDGIYPWDPKTSEHFKAWQPVLGKTTTD